MSARIAFGFVVMIFLLAFPANADGKKELQRHFNDVATKVKATDEPTEKRVILDESFRTMLEALDMVQRSQLISKDDGVALDLFKATLRENQDELAGINGFAPVPDDQLNSFSNYVMQSVEQADGTISISLVSLLLIVILLVLLL